MQIADQQNATPQPIVQTLTKKNTDPTSWSYFFRIWTIALIFIGSEIAYQFFFVSNRILEPALISGTAFAGGTLIGLALFTSAFFKWYPKYARFWPLRRHLGDAGAVSLLIHATSVLFFLFGGKLRELLYSADPFVNPIIFGLFALTILTAMLLTSTDWAMKKMGPRRWKFLHRFVYLAFPASIFHYTLTNPTIYREVPGMLLVGTNALAVFGQVFWFFKTIKARRYRNAGTYVGTLIIILTLLTVYIAFFR